LPTITRQEKPPWFPTNTIKKPIGVWPTFVSFPRARAFQGDGPNSVYRHSLATWNESNSEERKKVMGFQIGITSHTEVVRLEHNALLEIGMEGLGFRVIGNLCTFSNVQH
jgi:hypothetical protein